MKKTIFSLVLLALLVIASSVQAYQAIPVDPFGPCAPGHVFNYVTGDRCSVVTKLFNYCSYKHLAIGSTGTQVIELQTKLISDGYLVMPYGVAKGYYGNLTAQAVVRAKAAGVYNCDVVKTSTIKVVSPNGGESWLDQSTQNIVWNPIGCAGCQYFARYNPSVDINLFSQSANFDCQQAGGEICPQDISAMYNLDRNIHRTNSSYSWIVATDINDKQIPAGKYKVQVCVAGSSTDCDVSDNYFEIFQAQAN